MLNYVSNKFIFLTFGSMLLLTLMFVPAMDIQAKHKHLEKEYQNKLCKFIGGQTEYRLDNDRRVDCVDSVYAIEADFSYKVFEGIGQAEYYAYKTNKKAGLLLIIEKDKDFEVAREFHDYLVNHKHITYVIMYAYENDFYVVKPQDISEIPSSLKECKGLKL